MVIIVSDSHFVELELLEGYLSSSVNLKHMARDRKSSYVWVSSALRHYRYSKLTKPHKGLVSAYLVHMTGYSLSQTKRLIASWLRTGSLKPKTYKRTKFATKYTMGDIELLAAVDNAHEVLSGPATKKILEREYLVYSNAEYSRLANISTGHIYNLRHTERYRLRCHLFSHTSGPKNTLGIRSKPRPGDCQTLCVNS
jgi:hypothetical protein